ncbi:hypothetical protein HY414_01515 [Candidatus Kaiserbacteria bacterium]|nr:hypothetical protein [Candidatus Kaiserbacteria bacterium]
MKDIKKVFTATALSILLPASVFALDVSVGSGGSANVGVGVPGSADVQVGAKSTTSADTNTSAESTAVVETVVSIPAGAEVIVITRSDVEAGGTVEASAAPSSVQAESDLSGFVAAQIMADVNVSKVETSRDRISVTYPQKAKLLGFIPVTVQATAMVEADGSVDVQYPWYAFLMVTNEADLEAEIASRIVAKATLETSATAELTANAQAELIDEVRAVMQNELAVDAGGTVAL